MRTVRKTAQGKDFERFEALQSDGARTIAYIGSQSHEKKVFFRFGIV
jgi:hypothetical protein